MIAGPVFAAQKGSLPVLQYCPPGQLSVDSTYQRELDGTSRQLIHQIARHWDWNLYQPLVVARRVDGTLWVVDGQHRLEGARLRNKHLPNDIGQLPCVIFHPADPADEAAVFVELNQARRPLTAYALFNGALASGDAQAYELAGILDRHGLSFAGGADTARLKPGQINIVGRVRAWHRRHGHDRANAAIGALARVVRNHGAAGHGVMFAAICAIVTEQGEQLNSHLFGDILDRPAEEWAKDFHAHAATHGVGLQAAAIAVLRAAHGEALVEIGDDT